jgi:threonine dehydrogenase-like Zn-dependent dehydrogenase
LEKREAMRPDTVQAAVMTGPGAIELRQYPYPRPQIGESVVRVIAVGICGTDKHTYRGETSQYAGTSHARQVPYPLIPGHEIVAVVDDPKGQDLERDSEGMALAPGDRIVVAPDVACGRCYFCRGSFPYYYCEALQDYGNSLSCDRPPHLFGAWAEHMFLLRGTKVFRVPDLLPTEVAVLTEETAVTHGLDSARHIAALRGGDVFAESVVVFGVGPLGMCHCIKAQALGAATLIAVDVSSARLAAAKNVLGASLVLDASRLSRTERREAVYGSTAGRGADVVVDCTGQMGSLGEAVDLVRQGGVVVEAGAFVDLGPAADFHPAAVCSKEVAVLGVGGERAEHYSGALRLLAKMSERFPLTDLISHRFPLSAAKEAIETATDPSSLKVLVTPGMVEWA